jgi:dTDP-4-dehydrorhamnose reductase/UDP-glucose 4-epimerase
MVINFAFDPCLMTEEYDESLDVDLRLAKAAKQSGAHYLMLSSRRVYAKEEQQGANEKSPVEGIDAYGRNKAKTEAVLRELLPEDRLTILRIGNVIGFEYPRNRMSFMGYILSGLKSKGFVEFTTSPEGVRDFISDEHFAKVLMEIVSRGLAGTYNLGSGHPVAIGKLAEWVLEGYGEGDLRVANWDRTGEFHLDISKLQALMTVAYPEADLKAFCIGLGRRLRGC